jgi:hypothetical protein
LWLEGWRGLGERWRTNGMDYGWEKVIENGLVGMMMGLYVPLDEERRRREG